MLLAPKSFTQEREPSQGSVLRNNYGNYMFYVLMFFSSYNLLLSNDYILPITSPKTKTKKSLQIIEACLVSLITSFISFGLPLLRKCSPCPDSDPDSGIECPRPPGMYGNYVNVSSDTGFCSFWITFKVFFLQLIIYLTCNFEVLSHAQHKLHLFY